MAEADYDRDFPSLRDLIGRTLEGEKVGAWFHAAR
jgi:hypothetical protein